MDFSLALPFHLNCTGIDLRAAGGLPDGRTIRRMAEQANRKQLDNIAYDRVPELLQMSGAALFFIGDRFGISVWG